MIEVKIRAATFDTDLLDIIMLDRYINGERLASDIRNEYKKYSGTIFVAEQEGEIVGYISFSPHHWNHIAMIDHIAVKENYRRQGIGAQLIRHVIQKATQKQHRILAVQTALWNYDGMQFYKSNGFVVRAILPGYFGPNNDMIWMDKDL